MIFHILTLFPEMILNGMQTSVLGRAVNNGRIAFHAVDIRDYTQDRHKKVDDYPYGGGAGMLMQAQPVYDAFLAVKEKSDVKKLRLIYLTPQGKPFDQKMARELAQEEELALLCGHYEGVDERVLEEIVTDYVSIGDYVLTGGELPAMVVMDAVSRLVPGVLNNESSADLETFHNELLEYPQYSRPEEWHGKKVPAVLLSGNHTMVEGWRLEQSERRTAKNRPDLYEKYRRRQYFIHKMDRKNRRMYMDMIESLRRGRGEILYGEEHGLAVCDRQANTCMLAAFEDGAASKIVAALPPLEGVWQLVVHQDALLSPLRERFQTKQALPVRQAVYTQKVMLPVSRGVRIEPLPVCREEEVIRHYSMTDEDYIRERLSTGNLFGAFVEEELAGFGGIHREGSIGMLEVFEPYRQKGIGSALETFLINRQLSFGQTPYGNIVPDNAASLSLQKKLGLALSREVIYWVEAKERTGLPANV